MDMLMWIHVGSDDQLLCSLLMADDICSACCLNVFSAAGAWAANNTQVRYLFSSSAYQALIHLARHGVGNAEQITSSFDGSGKHLVANCTEMQRSLPEHREPPLGSGKTALYRH